jgi:hypothetical protein
MSIVQTIRSRRRFRDYLWAIGPSLLAWGFLALAAFAFLGAMLEKGLLH